MPEWKTYKGLYPWQVKPPTSLAYNEGDKIALAPKVSGGSPVWDMEHHGKAITDEHIPCQYWFNGDWEAAYVITKLCESINIAYISDAMLANTTQALSLEDANGNTITADIVTWTLSGVGSLTGEVGSSSVYNAPVEYSEEYNTATIEVWCNGVVRDTLVITIINSSISYTTPQQPPGTTQDLPINNPNPACEYTWELVGGGSLSVVNGVMRYTAPTTNPNCENNATISLLCNGVVIDTIKIAINIPTYLYAAFAETVPFCVEAAPGGSVSGCSGVAYNPSHPYNWEGGGCVTVFNCFGAVLSKGSNASCWSYSSSGCGIGWCAMYPGTYALTDLRTPAMIAAGCCPAPLM